MLDLGCGDGSLLAYLMRERNVRGYGIEIDDMGVSPASATASTFCRATWNRGLAGFDDASFDCVILSQTLQAMRHTEEIIAGDAARRARGDRHVSQLRPLVAPLADPQGAHARVRPGCLYQWYDTPNIHFVHGGGFRRVPGRAPLASSRIASCSRAVARCRSCRIFAADSRSTGSGAREMVIQAGELSGRADLECAGDRRRNARPRFAERDVARGALQPADADLCVHRISRPDSRSTC